MFISSILVLVLVVANTISYKLNPKGPIHQNYSSDCVLEIVQKQFVPYKKFLTILTTPNMTVSGYGVQEKLTKRINQLSLWSLEILSGERIQFESGEICLNCFNETNPKHKITKNIFQAKVKTEFCLMVIDSYENFMERLQDYLKAGTYNFRAYFLVYYSEITQNYKEIAFNILVSLWNNKIYNAAIIISKNSLKNFNIYGLEVYAPSEMCGKSPQLFLLDKCNEGTVERNARLFGNKLPKTFGGCSIETVAMMYPPFVVNNTEGFEIYLLDQLGKILNINFNLDVEQTATEWGTRVSKNNWTGPLQGVLEKSAIAIGNVMADPDLAEDFDLSIGYFYEHLVWIVPIALPLPQWKNIFVIFSYQLWMACIGYFILTAVLFQIAASLDDEFPEFRNLGTNFMTSLRILAGIASPRLPKTFLVRIAFLCIAAYSMILIVLYQSLLMIHLTSPVYEKQISTVQDILDSNNGIGGLESYKDFFNVSTDKTAMKIYKMFEIYDKINDTAYIWLLTVADDRDTCTVSSSFYVRYLMSQNDKAVTEYEKPRVFILKDVVFTYPIRMVLPKGFPLQDMFDKIIGFLINGGIIQEWTNWYRRNKVVTHDDDKRGQLTLDHMQGAFILLLFGYIFGLSAFLSELFANYVIRTGKVDQLQKWLSRGCAKCKRQKLL